MRRALLALPVLFAPTIAAQETDGAFAHELERRSRAMMEAAHLPGLAIGIVRGDSLVFETAYGVADRETRRGIDGETLFQVGSLSKSFTATLLALLVDDELIRFDDPIQRHLPPDLTIPAGDDGTQISVADLAMHMSGLPRQPPTLRRLHGDFPVLAFTHFELYQSIERSRLQSTIGTTWDYSNFGYSVLGHVLERAADSPYEVLLKERIFDPLGMRSSTVTIWPQLEPRLARPYYWNNRTNVLEDYTPWDTEAMAPAGGIASTVRDLAKFMSYQLAADGTLVALREPQARLNDAVSYGMGWFATEMEGVGPVINHGGEVDGYTSYFGFSTVHDLGVIILTNAGDGPLEDLAEWVLVQLTGP